MIRFLLLSAAMIMLQACSSQPAGVARTAGPSPPPATAIPVPSPSTAAGAPAPTRSGFETYRRADGLVSFVHPADWTVTDRSLAGELLIHAATRGADFFLWIAKRPAELEGIELERHVAAVLGRAYGTRARLDFSGAESLPDGGRRIAGALETPAGTFLANLFLDADSEIVISELVVAPDERFVELSDDVNSILNSVTFDRSLLPDKLAGYSDLGANIEVVGTSTALLSNTVIVQGELCNRNPVPVELLSIGVQVRVAGGSELGATEMLADILVLRECPPHRIPIAIEIPISSPVEDVDVSFELHAEAARVFASFTHFELDVPEESIEVEVLDSGAVSISGAVLNIGQQAAEFTRVFVTLYDDAESVIGTTTFELAAVMPPGEQAPFQVDVTPLAGEASTVTIVAEGLILEP